MSEPIVEHGVMVPLRDGTLLATDVYRPTGSSRSSVLLHRTPYGKSGGRVITDLVFDPRQAVERGFAVAIQDVRGTGDSKGTLMALVQERDDGHDTIEWLAEQPWCTGSVGMYGSSYMGVTTLQAAVDGPPPLKAIFAYVTGSNYFTAWTYAAGGAFELTFNVRWTIAKITEALARRGGSESSDSVIRVKELLDRFATNPHAFLAESFDVRALLEPAHDLAPFFFDWLEHSEYDEYWRAIDVAAAAGRIGAPVLHVGGWYDGFLNGHLALQRGLDASADRSPARRHRFVIGPWSHDAYLTPETACSAGQRNFGPDARGGSGGIGDLALRWFSHWLDGGPDVDLPPVRYFQMGENTWYEAPSWPPPHSPVSWYLHSGGRAATRSGDGELSLESPPADEAADRFDYDPHAPCPTVGGRHLAYPLALTGVQDQGGIEDRDDVLVYTSLPLEEPVRIAGPVAVRLFIQTSAPTTDFFATLVDVDPAGGAANVADGVCRLAPRPSADNDVKAIEIDLLHTAYTFAKGHRLRLDITSSNFPRLDRNPNVSPSDRDRDNHAVVAHQTVRHDADHPSALVLPVAPQR